MTKRIAFFDTKPYDKASFEDMNASFGFDVSYFDMHLNEQTAPLSQGFDAVCAFVNDSISESVIDQLVENKINILALRCAGYNNVDLKAAYNRLHVVRVPAYSPHAVAEHAIALLLTLNRKTHRAYHRVREGNFSIDGLLGMDLFGKTAGLIGAGTIGKCFANILKGFGMDVIIHDPYPDEEYAAAANVRFVSLQELFAQSDIISLHCPLTEETTHILLPQNTVGNRSMLA